MGILLVIISNTICNFKEEEKDYGFEDGKCQITPFCSRLSKTLPKILADKGAFGYFTQFMDLHKEIALIKFWLEIECLCGAYSTEESLQNRNKNSTFLLNSIYKLNF